MFCAGSFVITNLAYPNEMPHNAAFHLDFHCLLKYPFIEWFKSHRIIHLTCFMEFSIVIYTLSSFFLLAYFLKQTRQGWDHRVYVVLQQETSSRDFHDLALLWGKSETKLTGRLDLKRVSDIQMMKLNGISFNTLSTSVVC